MLRQGILCCVCHKGWVFQDLIITSFFSALDLCRLGLCRHQKIEYQEKGTPGNENFMQYDSDIYVDNLLIGEVLET